MENVKIKLSALWAARMLSGFLGDVLRFTDPGVMEQVWAGESPIPLTRGMLLLMAILMVIPIFMVVLSLTLKYKVNRWANMIIGIFFVVFDLIFLISLFPYGSPAYEIFLGFVYLIFTALVVWHAWKWPKLEVSPKE